MILVVFEYVEKVDQWLVSVACSIFQGSLVNRESDQLFLEEKIGFEPFLIKSLESLFTLRAPFPLKCTPFQIHIN